MTISVPSYVIPGTYLENVEFLAAVPEIDAVELLFFFYDDDTRDLFRRERTGLEARLDRFRYSVHLPDTVLPEHDEIVDETRDLASHYIVHPPRAPGAPPLRTFLPGWIDRYGDMFLVENTRVECFEECIAGLPEIGICCDTGHLLLEGRSPHEFLERYGERVRQIHLHGLRAPATDAPAADERTGVRDHHPVSADAGWLREIVPHLRSFAGFVELEVFSYEHVLTSLSQLRAAGALPSCSSRGGAERGPRSA